MGKLKSEELEAVGRICKNLNISMQQFFNILESYTDRVFELNQKTVEFTKNFIFPKGIVINDKFEYVLSDDDKSILNGYKNSAINTLKKEFPEIYENWEDFKMFQTNDINPNLFK